MAKLLKSTKKNKVADKPEQPTANNQQPSTKQMAEENDNIHDKHKEFRDKAAESAEPVKETVNNEPVLENYQSAHPFESPTIERDYTTQGYKKDTPPTQPQSNAGSGSQKPPIDGGTEPTPPPMDDYEPTPPPTDDPNYAGEHNINDGQAPGADPTNPFNIPAGSAEDLVDFGAKSLNFLIGNFAGLLVGIKVKPEYYSIKDNRERAVDIIKQWNDNAVEKLKLDAEDVAMLKGPLVKILQQKGIRGLTPGEELLLACALIAAKKVRIIAELRNDKKQFISRLDNIVKNMKGPTVDPQPEATAPPSDEPETVEVEEVN